MRDSLLITCKCSEITKSKNKLWCCLFVKRSELFFKVLLIQSRIISDIYSLLTPECFCELFHSLLQLTFKSNIVSTFSILFTISDKRYKFWGPRDIAGTESVALDEEIS